MTINPHSIGHTTEELEAAVRIMNTRASDQSRISHILQKTMGRATIVYDKLATAMEIVATGEIRNCIVDWREGRRARKTLVLLQNNKEEVRRITEELQNSAGAMDAKMKERES